MRARREVKAGTRTLVATLACALALAPGRGALAATTWRAPVLAASSAGPAAAGPQAKSARPGERWVFGRLIAVKKGSLAIDSSGHMRTLRIGTGTRIVVNGERASARELEPGAPVAASYEGTGRGATATLVKADEVRRPGQAAR